MSEQATPDGVPARRRRGERLLGEPAAPAAPRPERPAGEVVGSLRRAAIAVVLEAVLLAGVAVYLLVLTFVDEPASTGRALAEVVYFGIGALALLVAARGLWRNASWARGPVVVLQLLLGLFAYQAALTFQRPELGLPVGVLVVSTLYLLVTPEARLAYAERDVRR